MPSPSSIKYLLEALRGGDYRQPRETRIDRSPGVPPRRYPGTEQSMMPTGLRGYQLYVEEAKATGQPPIGYQEWLASQ